MNKYIIELGHNGIKTYYNGTAKFYPIMDKAPYDKKAYVEFYKKRAPAIGGAMSMDGLINENITLRVIVPRYISNQDALDIEKVFEKVKLSNKKLDFNIFFIAQAQGAYIKHILDNKFNSTDLENSGTRVVVDFGLNQTQILAFDRGSEVKDAYECVNYGVEHLVLKLQHEILSQKNELISYSDAIDLLKKHKQLNDEASQYRDSINEAIDEFLKYLFTYELNDNSFQLLAENITLLSGGGAEFIDYEKFKQYTNNDIGFNIEEPSFADIKGAYFTENFIDLLTENSSL